MLTSVITSGNFDALNFELFIHLKYETQERIFLSLCYFFLYHVRSISLSVNFVLRHNELNAYIYNVALNLPPSTPVMSKYI